MSINENKDLQKLTLKNVKILFSNLNDPKFGNSITIDVTDNALQQAIAKFYKDNNFSKEPSFKTYVSENTNITTVQWTIKLSKFLTFVTPFSEELSLEDLKPTDLERGTIINMIAYAYNYKNNFGEGVTCAAQTIVSKGRPTSQKNNDIKELMD